MEAMCWIRYLSLLITMSALEAESISDVEHRDLSSADLQGDTLCHVTEVRFLSPNVLQLVWFSIISPQIVKPITTTTQPKSPSKPSGVYTTANPQSVVFNTHIGLNAPVNQSAHLHNLRHNEYSNITEQICYKREEELAVCETGAIFRTRRGLCAVKLYDWSEVMSCREQTQREYHIERIDLEKQTSILWLDRDLRPSTNHTLCSRHVTVKSVAEGGASEMIDSGRTMPPSGSPQTNTTWSTASFITPAPRVAPLIHDCEVWLSRKEGHVSDERRSKEFRVDKLRVYVYTQYDSVMIVCYIAHPNVSVRLCKTQSSQNPDNINHSHLTSCSAVQNVTVDRVSISGSTGRPYYKWTMTLDPGQQNGGEYRVWSASESGQDWSREIHLRLARLDDPKGGEPVGPQGSGRIVEEGQEVLLGCKIPVSLPPASVRWTHFSPTYMFLPYPVEIDNRVSIASDGSLIFANTLLNDSGRYDCEISNAELSSGHIAASVNLTVVKYFGATEADKRPELVGRHTQADQETWSVVMGDQLTLHCHFIGRPTPTVLWWIKRGTEVEELKSSERLKFTGGNQSLTLTSVLLSDSGEYRCTGENRAGRSNSHSIDVIVYQAALLTERPLSINTTVGYNESFECAWIGKPLPQVYWLVNGGVLTDDARVTGALTSRVENVTSPLMGSGEQRSRLWLNSVTSSLTVQCRVYNRYGSDVATAFISAHEPVRIQSIFITERVTRLYNESVAGDGQGLDDVTLTEVGPGEELLAVTLTPNVLFDRFQSLYIEWSIEGHIINNENTDISKSNTLLKDSDNNFPADGSTDAAKSERQDLRGRMRRKRYGIKANDGGVRKRGSQQYLHRSDVENYSSKNGKSDIEPYNKSVTALYDTSRNNYYVVSYNQRYNAGIVGLGRKQKRDVNNINYKARHFSTSLDSLTIRRSVTESYRLVQVTCNVSNGLSYDCLRVKLKVSEAALSDLMGEGSRLPTSEASDGIYLIHQNGFLWGIAAIIVVACVSIILVVGGVILYCRRRLHKLHVTGETTPSTDTLRSHMSVRMSSLNYSSTDCLVCENSHQREVGGKKSGGGGVYATMEVARLMTMLKDMLIPREWLELDYVLGKGQFGRVYSATLSDKKTQIIQHVAVKAMKYKPEEVEMVKLFLNEAVLMKDFRHEHVLGVVGVSFDEDGSPLVVLPYMANGDLRQYIMQPDLNISVLELIKLGIQVAQGMIYLSYMRFVHRDLAARNCMINDRGVVKVADFGMSRELLLRDYYRVEHGTSPVAVRWMAPECLEASVFTTMSDVWSYGVLLWELMTRGSVPYPEVENHEIRAHIQGGGLLQRPDYCPSIVYFIMLSCWEEEPLQRPSFQDLVEVLESVIRKDPISPPTPSHLGAHPPALKNNSSSSSLDAVARGLSDTCETVTCQTGWENRSVPSGGSSVEKLATTNRVLPSLHTDQCSRVSNGGRKESCDTVGDMNQTSHNKHSQRSARNIESPSEDAQKRPGNEYSIDNCAQSAQKRLNHDNSMTNNVESRQKQQPNNEYTTDNNCSQKRSSTDNNASKTLAALSYGDGDEDIISAGYSSIQTCAAENLNTPRVQDVAPTYSKKNQDIPKSTKGPLTKDVVIQAVDGASKKDPPAYSVSAKSKPTAATSCTNYANTAATDFSTSKLLSNDVEFDIRGLPEANNEVALNAAMKCTGIPTAAYELDPPFLSPQRTTQMNSVDSLGAPEPFYAHISRPHSKPSTTAQI